eukprot:6294733-Prymnesium_polylepis.1
MSKNHKVQCPHGVWRHRRSLFMRSPLRPVIPARPSTPQSVRYRVRGCVAAGPCAPCWEWG